MKQCLAVVLVCILSLSYPAVAAEVAQSEIIRIHVLAHHDTESEQQLKLRVRDAILEFVCPLVNDATSSAQALSIIESHLEEIKAVADNCLRDLGSTHVVQMQWGVFVFPTRVYGQSVLPAGKYTALNIHIGNGQGKNWWCVMYPPLCYVDGVVGKGQQTRYEFAIVNWMRTLLRRIWS
ncbi:MAG: stage II sporulation protein R [Bacillota bacterium]|nr:MAG: stage II sporulation protein R [Bacillota bacterium]